MTSAAHATARGTLRIFAADALMLPAGLIITAYLTRRLGAGAFGVYTLAVTIVVWLEWTLSSLFARATLRFVGDADDWRPVGATVTWLNLCVGVGAAALLALLATPIAGALGAPEVAPHLRLLALDLPLFCLATAHRNILVGLGRYDARAVASAARWVVRVLLVVALVEGGLWITGAVIGTIAATAVELAVARAFVRPAWRPDPRFPLRRAAELALPLFLYAIAMRLLDRVDILALQVITGSVAQVGIYGAAQTLAVPPGLFALALSSLLISTLSRLQRDGDAAAARDLAAGAMRAVLLLVPFAALVAGGARPIVRLVFGPAFAPGAPVVALLVLGAMGFVMISVASAVLVGAGHAGRTLAIAAPLVPLAVIGHLVAIPRLGAIGAAMVTASVLIVGAVASTVAVYRVWRVAPRASTLARTALVGAAVYLVAARPPIAGPAVVSIAQLAVLALLVPALLFALGELRRGDLAMLRAAP